MITNTDLSGGFFGTACFIKGKLHRCLPSSCFVFPSITNIKRKAHFSEDSRSHSEGTTGGAASRKNAHGPDGDLPAVGAILDKYRFEELVGKGAFAAVYRATHLLLKVPVAIKLLRPRAVHRTSGLAALLCEEARFAARINHPNVVRIFDVTHTSTITYVVMEYIDGSNLSKRIQSHGPLPFRTLLTVGIEVAEGLRSAWKQGLIHRDIKPSNILLSKEGSAKIVDLGLALPVNDAETSERFASLSVVGTPGYMAPEQGVAPSQVDFRADIYALGATLYHAALGIPPFPLDDSLRCMAMHRREPVTPPERVVSHFPPELSKLLQWMLAKNPTARPASYDILLNAMRRAWSCLPDEGKFL